MKYWRSKLLGIGGIGLGLLMLCLEKDATLLAFLLPVSITLIFSKIEHPLSPIDNEDEVY